MKKILKAAMTAAISCIMAVAFSVCVYAETEDVEMPVTTAKMTDGAWGQSVTYDVNAFDCSRMTPDTIVNVEFELDKEWTLDRAPVELILFNYTDELPRIWAKIEPYEWDTTSASFNYEAMVETYGYDDFSTVDNLCIGDTGVPMKVTKLTITNCTVIEVETTVSETEPEVTETEPTEAETTQAPATEAETEAATEATTAATTAASAEQGESGGITVILIIVVIAAVVIAGVVVTLVIVKKSKNRFY